MKRNKKRGLTLIELLAVIAIIAVLFIVLIPTISNAFNKARLTGIQTDLHSYEISLKSFLMEVGSEQITEYELNKFLDKELQFTDGKSAKKILTVLLIFGLMIITLFAYIL